jgi:hypothetical protein
MFLKYQRGNDEDRLLEVKEGTLILIKNKPNHKIN